MILWKEGGYRAMDTIHPILGSGYAAGSNNAFLYF